MTDENNEMKKDWILESLVNNNPFVLPSLEELQRMNNEIWSNKSKNVFNNYIINPLEEEKKHEIINHINRFEEKYGYPIPLEMKKIYLSFDIVSLGLGGEHRLGTIQSMIDDRLMDIEEMIEFSHERKVIIPPEYVMFSVSEYAWYAVNLEDEGIYGYLDYTDCSGDPSRHVKNINGEDMVFPDMKIANNFNLFLRGIIYAEIINQKHIITSRKKNQDVDIDLVAKYTKGIWEHVGGEGINYDEWAYFTGLGEFE